MKLNEMTKGERSLLIYIESVCVDYGGIVHSQRVNEEDVEILKRWDKEGFISYSHLTWNSIQTLADKHCTSLVRLSAEAWLLAQEERRARFLRISSKLPICNLITTTNRRMPNTSKESSHENIEN